MVLTELHSRTEIQCALHSSLQGLNKSEYLQPLACSELPLTRITGFSSSSSFLLGPCLLPLSVQCSTSACSSSIPGHPCFRCFRNTSCLQPYRQVSFAYTLHILLISAALRRAFPSSLCLFVLHLSADCSYFPLLLLA